MVNKYFTIILLIFFTLTGAAKNSAAGEFNADFHNWLINFNLEAQQAMISDKTIYNFMKDAQYLPKVIELDQKQPDKVKSFDQYLKNAMPPAKIKMARAKYKENKKLLDKIGKKYGVQPRFIVALWASESDFGRNMGSLSVLNSLATLAFEGRRADFFKAELINALKILDKGGIKQSELKGSWAGAMGQTQFMPSSYLEMAVDYNGDGKKDIWNTKADVFASIANYLSKSGWDKNSTWGREIELPENFDNALLGRNVEKNLSEWKALGVKNIDGKPIPNKKGLIASVVRVEDNNNSRAFLIYPNYKVVLKWNRSLYFASSISLLADAIK